MMDENANKEAVEVPVTKTKAERFAENPDSFICVEDCLLVIEVKRDEHGRILKYLMKADIRSEDEAHVAKGRAGMIVDSVLSQLMFRRAATNPVITPGGGNNKFMPNLRNFLNKKK